MTKNERYLASAKTPLSITYREISLKSLQISFYLQLLYNPTSLSIQDVTNEIKKLAVFLYLFSRNS